MDRLRERVAVVTGGGDGIGRGISRRFAAEGAKVLIAERDEEAGARVAKELQEEFGADARALPTDVAAKADNQAMVPAAKTAASRRVFAEHPELEASADAANPMGRLGDPEDDIAPVAVFLASEDVRYFTGNTLFVDGGGHINGAAWAPELPDE